MALRYNEYTAVDQDYAIAEDSYTQYMNNSNIVGRSQDIQTTPYSKVFNHGGGGSGSITETLLEDIVLTSVEMNISVGGDSGATGSLRIDLCKGNTSNILLTEKLAFYESGVSGSSVICNQVFPIPNWEFKKGEILISNFTRVNGTETSAICNLIGFKK